MGQSSMERAWGAMRSFIAGSLVFGFGLGGLADGIVLHQVLQWHNLVSDRVTNQTLAGLQANVFWDGVFHLTTTVLLVVGVLLLGPAWHSREHAPGNFSALAGLTLIGWGAFHVVDQLVFHELLDLHNIREGVTNSALYNWGFFAIGLVLAASGAAFWRSRGAVGQTASRSDP